MTLGKSGKFVGFSGFLAAAEAVRSNKERNRFNHPWPMLIDMGFSDVVVPSGEYDCRAVFKQCVLSNIVLKDVSLTGELEAIDSIIDGLVLSGVECAHVYVSDVVMRNSKVSGVKFRELPMPGFVLLENCVLRDVKIDGAGYQVLQDVRDCVISGELYKVIFRENATQDQCRGVDLSQATIHGCIFEGIDMRRMVCNPAWEHLIVDDWYQVAPKVMEVGARLRESKDPQEVKAGWAIKSDLGMDEQAYGRPLDAQRGAKYLYQLDAPWIGTRRRRILQRAYKDAGIDLPPLPKRRL